MADKKLCKSTKHRMLSGVCGGFADFFNIDREIWRQTGGKPGVFDEKQPIQHLRRQRPSEKFLHLFFR